MRKMLVMALVMVPVAVLALTPPPAAKWTDNPTTAAVNPVLKSQDFDRVRVDELISYIRYLFEPAQAIILDDADPYFFFAYNDAQSHVSTAVFNESQMMDPAAWVVQDIVEWTGGGTLRYVAPTAYYDGSVWYPQVAYNCYAPDVTFWAYDEGGIGSGIWTNPIDVGGPVYDTYLPLVVTSPDNMIYMDGQARDVAGDSHVFEVRDGLDGTLQDPPGEIMLFPRDAQYGTPVLYSQNTENAMMNYGGGNLVVASGGYRDSTFTDANNPMLIVYAASSDGGMTWGDWVWLDKALIPDLPGAIPGIAAHYSNDFFDNIVAPDGSLHFLAPIADSGYSGNTSYIHGMYYMTNASGAWTAVQVSDGVYPDFDPRSWLDGDSYMHSPSLALGPDGTLIAAWNDLAVVDMADTSLWFGIWASYSNDGVNWSDPEMVAGEVQIDEYFSRLVPQATWDGTSEMGYAYVLTMPTGGSDGPLDLIKYPYMPSTSADMKPVVQKLDVIGPNPSQGNVTVALNLNVAGKVEAGIYNINGQLVQTLHKGVMTAGAHELTWDGSNAAAGIYFARVTSGSQSMAAKVVLVK